jgi:uncharacterized membrane protein YdbT with pleckstrin-like domain
MSYVQDNLMPNEKVLFQARIHSAVFLPAIVSFVMSIAIVVCGIAYSLSSQEHLGGGSTLVGFVPLMALGFIIYSIGSGLHALIIKLTTEFAVTNWRIIAKAGFIRRNTLEMLLPKVESVAVQQNIFGRLLNFGTVMVTGTGGTREGFRAIAGPLSVRNNINQIIEHYAAPYAEQRKGGGG